MSKKNKSYLPSKEEIIKFIKLSSHDLSKREITKAFNIKGDMREPFKALLKEIETSGTWQKNTRRSKKSEFKSSEKFQKQAGRKGATLACVVAAKENDTTYILKPLTQTKLNEEIVLTFSDFALEPGHKVLIKVTKNKTNQLIASFLKLLPNDNQYTMIGVFKPVKNGGYVYPASKKQKKETYVPASHTFNAKEGDIVRLVTLDENKNQPNGKITEILGNIYEPKGLSLISILQHNLPFEFQRPVIAEAEKGTVPLLGKREDLRKYPLVTIDGEDARDFDDAVFAEPQENGGWHVIVAIADVAHYVKPSSELDKEAYARGNSVYFPDRVLPMLPEKLSNDLCSLRPNQDRACLAVHIYLDKDGNIETYQFVRGLMCSSARLTYNEAQAIYDETIQSPLRAQLNHMYDVYALLLSHRKARGALDIDLPEHQVLLTPSGELEDIRIRNRLDSHKLIEELMILANICAARALERKNIPGVYRIHETPTEARVQTLKDFLTFIKLIEKNHHLVTPHDFNHVIYSVKNTAQHTMVSEMVLRSQQQAMYSPQNHGHFGLGLTHYAHFTSPIRRYADLIVHRALIKAFDLGDDGLTDKEIETLKDISVHITEREKEAETAEREVISRYLSLFMLESGKLHYTGRITSIMAFGMFVQIDETGINGMIPIASLPDFFIYNEAHHELKGRSSGVVYRLGDKIDVTLEDVNVLTGQISFNLKTRSATAPPSRKKHKR
jgi:ribonuclease R